MDWKVNQQFQTLDIENGIYERLPMIVERGDFYL